MGSRSNISVVGNTTNAVNCGIGTGYIFIDKENDNILNFRSIAAAGSLSIITGATTITISGSTDGSTLLNGILLSSGNTYNPYPVKLAGRFYTGNTNPSCGCRLNYDGCLYLTNLFTVANAADAVVGTSVSGVGLYGISNTSLAGKFNIGSGNVGNIVEFQKNFVPLAYVSNLGCISGAGFRISTAPSASTCTTVLVWDSADNMIKINSSISGGSGTITGGTNGLSLADAYTLKLGGELCEPTIIDVFGYPLEILGTNTGIIIDDLNAVCICAGFNSLEIITSGTTYYSITCGDAIRYGADYSANYVNRSIPDVAYVTGYTQSQISGLIGGINGSIQYNDNGVFSGSSAFVFDDSLNTFSFYGTPNSPDLVTMTNPYGYGQNFKYLGFTCCEGTEIGGICYCGGDIHFHGRSIVPHSSEVGLVVGCQGKDTTLCGCQVNVLGQKWFTLAQSGLSNDKTIFVTEFTVPASGCCELFIMDYDSGTTISLNGGINYFCVLGLASGDGVCTCCAACKIEGIMDDDGAILGTPTYTTLFDNTGGEYQFLVSGITGNFHVYGCSTIPTCDSIMSAKINIYGIQ